MTPPSTSEKRRCGSIRRSVGWIRHGLDDITEERSIKSDVPMTSGTKTPMIPTRKVVSTIVCEGNPDREARVGALVGRFFP
jgi:hypothetical protein